MNARKWIRIVSVLAGVAALLTAAVCLIIWLQLPSWKSVAAGLRSVKPVRRQESAVAVAPAAAATPAPAPGRRQPASAPTPLPFRGPPGTVAPESQVASYLIERFVNGNGGDIRVCANWIDTPTTLPNTPTSFTKSLEQKATGDATENVFIESSLAAIANVLRVPSVGQVLTSLQTAATNNDPDYANGEKFRSELALASADLIANQAALEQAAQHAYHLFVLSRVMTSNTMLANDGTALALCSRIESLVNQPRLISDQDMNLEKATVLRWLAQAGASPEQVGFDPNLRNPVQTKLNASGISISVPWLIRQVGTPLKIVNTMAQPTLNSGSVSGSTSGPTTGAPAAP